MNYYLHFIDEEIEVQKSEQFRTQSSGHCPKICKIQKNVQLTNVMVMSFKNSMFVVVAVFILGKMYALLYILKSVTIIGTG